MKTNFIATILIGIILLILSLIAIPRLVVNHYWKKAEEYHKIERFKTALDYALKAKQVAKTWHLKPAYVKSLLFEIRSKVSLHYSLEEIINLLHAEKDANPTPLKEIISSFYLEKLWDYYFRHQRWYGRETQTFLDEGNDVKSWSNKRTLQEIMANIYAIQQTKKLKSYSFSAYQRQICSSSENQIRFNTVYEFLTWHSIELLNWSNRFFYEDYVARNPADQFFVPMKDFLKQPVATTDTFDLYTNSMALYQNLLKFEIDNFNHRLTYEIELQRLNNLREKDYSDEDDKRFLPIVESYRKSVKYKDVQILLDFALMNEYKTQRRENEYKRKCLEIIKRYPEYTPEVKECKKVMADLSRKSIDFSVSNTVDLGKPIEAEINAQNTDTVYCNFYKLPAVYNLIDDLEIKTVDKYKPLVTNCLERRTVTFPHEFSMMQAKKVSFANAGYGAYLVVIGYKKNLNDFKNVKEWKVVKVTSIGSFAFGDLSGNEIYVVKKKNGEPVKKASLVFYTQKNILHSFITDGSGKARVPDSILSNKVIIGYKGDTIALNDRSLSSYDYDEDETIHIKLFTDRAVYRPSQKIYFKGILTEKDPESRKYLTLSNQKVHVIFKNYDFTYGEQDLVTNEFGSFSGFFQIPANVSLGRMQLETRYGEQSVQIEEYKPTKMRLTVLPYNQPTGMGDSMIVTGYTKYLNGTPSRNLPITYKIQCETRDFRNFLGSSTINGTTYSDQFGQFKIRLKTHQNPKDKLNQYTYDYNVLVECKDDFGEIQSETTHVSVGYNSCTASIKLDEFLAKKPDIKIPVEFSYNDNPIHAQSCKLTIYRLEPKPDKSKKDTIYSDISDVTFDSMKRSKIVFEKTLTNLSGYEFDASSLNNEEPGFYVAEINADINNKIHVSEQSYFTLLEKADANLNLNLELFFIPLKKEGKPCETVSFIAGSSLQDVYGLFTITKHHHILHREWIHLSKSQKIINVPVKDSYRGGFQASFICYVNEAPYEKSHLIKVPFDNKNLRISFTSFRNNLYPGQQETWNLKIQDHTGKPANAEMVASLYDEALDEIASNHYAYFPYVNFEEDEYSNGSWEFLSYPDMHGYGQSDNPILNDLEVPPPPPRYFTGELQCVSVFPTVNWNLDKKTRGRSSYYRRRRDSQCCYEKTKFEAARISFSDLASVSLDAPPPPPMRKRIRFVPPEFREDEVSESSAMKDYPAPLTKSPTRIRKDFRETAFFTPQARTNANGIVTFNFTMPDALTKWKMIGFAHTQDMKTGSITNELVTQKDFMVIPNWPRFFRSGDTVYFNVRIENNVAKSISGNISVEIQDVSGHKLITSKVVTSDITQNFAIKGKLNSSTRWKLVIPHDVSVLRFRVSAQSGPSADGEEMLIPVLPDEIMITESMPFFLPDNKPGIYQFDSFKKQHAKDIRNYQYVFEIDPNPKWNVINALGYLAGYPYECAEQTFNKYFGYCLAEYISKHNPTINQFFNSKYKETDELKSSLETTPDLKSCLLEESPWLFQAKTMSEKNQSLSKFFNNQTIEDTKTELSEKLEQFQNADGGIAWFKGMESSQFISFYLLEGLGKMKRLGILDTFNGEYPNFLNRLLAYSDQNLQKWYQDNKRITNYCTVDYLLTTYAYARSYLVKEHPVSKENGEAYNFLLKQLKYNWQKASYSQKPLVALILYRNKEYVVANQIIEALKEQATSEPDKGMYWKANDDYSFDYNPIGNQSAMLELFIETRQNETDIQHIKNWIYLHKKNNYWYSTISTAKACYSLLLNDPKWFENSTFNVEVGPYKFTTSNASSNVTGGFRKTWGASQISGKMSDIKIRPSGNDKSPTWGAAYWQYFARMDNIKETTSGVWIKKLYFVKKNNEYKQITGNQTIKVGDELIVRLELGTDKPLSYVHVKDLRATCMEPTDKTSGYHWQSEVGYFENIRDVSQNFFMEYLPKGKHLIEYQVRVTHKGHFQTGNATIQCMYSPEYVGNSKAVIINVE